MLWSMALAGDTASVSSGRATASVSPVDSYFSRHALTLSLSPLNSLIAFDFSVSSNACFTLFVWCSYQGPIAEVLA